MVSLYIPLLVHTDGENFRASPEKKHKAVVVSSDSEVYVLVIKSYQPLLTAHSSEILKSAPSPSKKRVQKALPTPGSKEFELLPPVSIA